MIALTVAFAIFCAIAAAISGAGWINSLFNGYEEATAWGIACVIFIIMFFVALEGMLIYA